MCWLYTGTFGSFIGFSAAFPLLSKILFPEVNALQIRLPRAARRRAVARAVAGKACDRIGGGRITFWVFIAMSLGVVGVLYAIGMKGSPTAFPVFFASFLFLFAATGVGNASTFQMIPAIMRKEVARLEPSLTGGPRQAVGQGELRRSSASPRRSLPMAPSSSPRASAPRSPRPAAPRLRSTASSPST